MPASPTDPAPSAWKRLFRLLAQDKKDVWYILTFAVSNGLIALSLPLGIQAILNLITTGVISTSWWVLIGVVLAGIALSGWVQILQMSVIEKLQQRIFTRASFEFAYRIPRFKPEGISRQDPPELVNRFFDTLTIQKGLPKVLMDFTTSLVSIFFGLVLLSFYHPFFVLFGLATVILIIIIFRYTFPYGLRTSLEESKYKYQTVHWLEEIAHSLYTFKLAGRSPLPLRRTDELVGKYLDQRESHFRVLLFQYYALVVFKVLITGALLIMGGWLVMDRQLSIGQFVAGEIVIVLVMGAAEKLTLVMDGLYDILTGLEKIGAITDLELEEDNGIQDPEPPSRGMEVELTNLNYSLSWGRILEVDRLRVAPGEKVVLSGPNGSGKSALLQLIACMYELPSGVLSMDGRALGAWELSSLRAQIGDNFSEEVFFGGTLWENITLEREGMSETEVMQIFSTLGLGDFIKRLPRGLHTSLGPEARAWPRSTVKRLILARALYCRPRLLLLEEPTLGLDGPVRESMIRLLTKDYPGTLITVGRDEWLTEACDRLLFMDQGRITGDGKPVEMKKHPLYNQVFHPSR